MADWIGIAKAVYEIGEKIYTYYTSSSEDKFLELEKHIYNGLANASEEIIINIKDEIRQTEKREAIRNALVSADIATELVSEWQALNDEQRLAARSMYDDAIYESQKAISCFYIDLKGNKFTPENIPKEWAIYLAFAMTIRLRIAKLGSEVFSPQINLWKIDLDKYSSFMNSSIKKIYECEKKTALHYHGIIPIYKVEIVPKKDGGGKIKYVDHYEYIHTGKNTIKFDVEDLGKFQKLLKQDIYSDMYEWQSPIVAYLDTIVQQWLEGPQYQDNWRWCNKCQVLFFGGNPPTRCPAGGVHDSGGSANYVLAYNNSSGQDNWRQCNKCQALFYAGNPPKIKNLISHCIADDYAHEHICSHNYSLILNPPFFPLNGQVNWRWCNKCQMLFFGGNPPTRCPAGGVHDSGGSGNYVLMKD